MINSTSSSDTLLESNALSKDAITSERREYLLKKWGPILK